MRTGRAAACLSQSTFAPPLQVHVQPATDIILPADAVNRQAGPARLRRRVLLVHAIGELAYWCTLILLLFVAETGQQVFYRTSLCVAGPPFLRRDTRCSGLGCAGWIAAAAHEHRRSGSRDLTPSACCGSMRRVGNLME